MHWYLVVGVGVLLYAGYFAIELQGQRNRVLLRHTGWLLLVCVAYAIFFVLPWALYEGWSAQQVVLAEVPSSRIRISIYTIYAALLACVLAVLHVVAAALFKDRGLGS